MPSEGDSTNCASKLERLRGPSLQTSTIRRQCQPVVGRGNSPVDFPQGFQTWLIWSSLVILGFSRKRRSRDHPQFYSNKYVAKPFACDASFDFHDQFILNQGKVIAPDARRDPNVIARLTRTDLMGLHACRCDENFESSGQRFVIKSSNCYAHNTSRCNN